MNYDKEKKVWLVPENDFNQIMFCMRQLNALIKYGVQEWKYYDEAMESLKETEEEF